MFLTGWGGGEWVDSDGLNNYRGIALQSCVGKLYGKILGNRLAEDPEARWVHSDFQFAFREGRSAMEAIYILGEILRVGIREAKECRWAFLDIRKAYNRVVREVLWEMKEAGYGGKVLRLIQRLYDENEGSFRLGWIQDRRMGWGRVAVFPSLFVIYNREAVERMVRSLLGHRDRRSDNSGEIFADDIVVCGR